MAIVEKGPGDVADYPSGSAKKLKLMPDGNPYPYEREYIAINGVQDDTKYDTNRGINPEDYSPKASKNTGDDGQG